MIDITNSVIYPVVAFIPGKDKLLPMNFTATNPLLTDEVIGNVDLLNRYITESMQHAGARYGVGGYLEPRVLYRRSNLFGSQQGPEAEEARSIHLGIDIWAAAGTPVYAPLPGSIHSFAFNNQYGDYGATIIIEHETEGQLFHTLYGHLSLNSISHLQKGQPVIAGALLAHFGNEQENGNWPPHLHFQVILHMEGKEGDYPGVCKPSEKEIYAANCPNPDLLLQLNRYL